MSKYTTELRFICESESGLEESVGYDNVDRVITSAIPKIFNFDFPIHDESYRNVLCRKILKHYYTREICAETYGRWKLFLDTKMNEIMPYYSELYRSATYDFNPLYNVDITTTHSGGAKGNNTRAGNSTGSNNLTRDVVDNGTTMLSRQNTSRDSYSDTPQGSLVNVDSGEYLTNYRKIENNGQDENNVTRSTVTNDVGSNTSYTSSNDNYTTTDEYVDHVVGKNSGDSNAKLIMEYRKSLINIDSMIIEELNELFMGLY